MATCKNDDCIRTDEDTPLEASGYCFECAEELACLLADAAEEFGPSPAFDPAQAWQAPVKEKRNGKA